jgi:hypothetical protein
MLMDMSDDEKTKPDPSETAPVAAAAFTGEDAPEPSGWNRRNWFITAWLERLEREKLDNP